MLRDRSSRAARALAAALMLGAPILVYRAVYLIGAGHAARYVVWLQVLTWVELLLAVSISIVALVWLVSGARAWCGLTLRLTAAIILLHAFRVAIFVIGRIGPLIDVDLRPEERPLDPASWDWSHIWIAGGLTVASLLVLAGALIWHRRMRVIHK
jgi:hypothetical protein